MSTIWNWGKNLSSAFSGFNANKLDGVYMAATVPGPPAVKLLLLSKALI